MVYESSYDSGPRPFKPDLARGYWAAPSDFIYTCISLGFRMDVMSMSWFLYQHIGGTIIVYILCMFLFVVPIIVIQSFMGQFSSSGFISTFRMSPIFKGLGYISLFVNLAVLSYYSLFAAVPLLYLFHSLRPILPWSCEGIEKWFPSSTEAEVKHSCKMLDIVNIKAGMMYNRDIRYEVPSVLFFKSIFGGDDVIKSYQYNSTFLFSWELLVCTLLSWAIVAGVFYRFYNTELMSKFLRYTIWTSLILLLICVGRFMLLPNDWSYIFSYFMAKPDDFLEGIPNTVIFIVSAFGPGWGSIIALASFNRFRANIMNYSWIICLGQMGIFMAYGIITQIIHGYFKSLTTQYALVNYLYVKDHWALYLSSGSVIATMSWPNLWSIIFYAMLTLTALITMITCLFSIYQSIFDEFEILRSRRTEVTLGLIGVLAFLSLYTCSNYGVVFFSAMSKDSLCTQTALNLLLLLVVLWIYGRVRFQRDIEFMLGQRFATWKVNMLRFVAPICLCLLLLIAIIGSIFEHSISSILILIAEVFFIVLPWLYLPGYMIYVFLQTTGSFKMRFQRCNRPMDWYPVEMEERQRYEGAMGNMDITHQLNRIADEVVP
ncbi:sodium- and chloride-dependent neutral and basic amino acid transporter B(0+)-like [Anastrepha obliqua]|uniref:sodium- and chloride-dependent neutral and basic amino acid transporter B(0+)-like n=1 Tax=Anastrepha obliqua TaxID=95512 RepID=UPI00240A248E|nr:sodium- and chloride-dependent neutral and basic amino acid transporter B(0+)-like [Anastrepha obliqua]XP_054741400.1 sodium- and chloride-dependent neutral and basic amino acid transporter B(0+)-like [Anastrepha obliqua]